MFPACEEFRLHIQSRLDASSEARDELALLEGLARSSRAPSSQASSSQAPSEHSVSCERCSSWLRARHSLLGHIASVQRFPAPAELDELVAAQIAGDHVTRAGKADTLPSDSLSAKLLGGLERMAAPAVLERLVTEELADPASARARRFVGDLERSPAPQSLTARLRQQLAGFRSGERGQRARLAGAASATRAWRSRRGVISSVGLLAAALLLWMRPTGLEVSQEQPLTLDGFSFRVREARSLGEFSSLARALVSSQSGAILGEDSGSVFVQPSVDGGARD